MNRLLITLLLVFFAANLSAQRTNITGLWKTVDDNTGKVRSVVEIYEQNGKIYGKIKQLFREPHEVQDPVCKECTDHRKDKKVVGMEIISGLKKDGNEYSGGKIMDPENGKSYDCKLWVEDGKLKVRGYIAFIYRTQTWLPHH
jgi:uncharacterized protein (DUF2147 family)